MGLLVLGGEFVGTIYVFLTRNFRRVRTVFPLSVVHENKLGMGAISIAKGGAIVDSRRMPVITSLLFRRLGRRSMRVVILPNKLPNTAGLSTRTKLSGLVVDFTTTKGPLTTVYTTPVMCNGHNLLGNGGTAYCPNFSGFLRKTRCAKGVIRMISGFVLNGNPNTTPTFNFAVLRGFTKTRGTLRIGGKVLLTW